MSCLTVCLLAPVLGALALMAPRITGGIEAWLADRRSPRTLLGPHQPAPRSPGHPSPLSILPDQRWCVALSH